MTSNEIENTRETMLKGLKQVFGVLKEKLLEESKEEQIWVVYIDECL
jgi:hypothetical protein